jgi:2-succinyl-5-enolpyruvyl-6-hydroxy-3-cyclohexene-1-carboxylate synthase
MTGIGDANATACATLVDEWVRCGVQHAVIAPGSRSTPVALALTQRSELEVHVVHDERVAAFVALGLGIDGVPAVLVCTSGTAAANFLPAVVEAGLSDVPMIVATADRPPELRGVGAPQTIDQLELYGRAVRWFHDAAVPDEADPADWRPLAQRVYATAAAGPVHLNLPFREPLLGEVLSIPEPIGPPLPVPRGIAVGGPALREFDRPRGVIVAGGRSGVDPERITALADRLGWPILADPCSGLRGTPHAVTAFDPILRSGDFAEVQAPELVIRVGRAPASKVLSAWIATSGAPVLQVGGPGVVDPDRNVTAFCSIDDFADFEGAADADWLATWLDANSRAEQALDKALAGPELSEPGVARVVSQATSSLDGELVAASSMPIRDVEWFGGPVVGVHANRGANGIDGVLSTAVGRALTGRTVFALVGDIAFVHDGNALVAIGQRNVDLRIVVVDNAGGGIFNFLPQARALTRERFEQLFGTPHGTDVVALAAAHSVDAETVFTLSELEQRLAIPGPTVTRIVTDRIENVAFHDEVNAAVAAAIAT